MRVNELQKNIWESSTSEKVGFLNECVENAYLKIYQLIAKLNSEGPYISSYWISNYQFFRNGSIFTILSYH